MNGRLVTAWFEMITFWVLAGLLRAAWARLLSIDVALALH